MSYISYLLLNLAILTTLVHLMVCYLPYHVNDLWLGMARLVATVVLVQGMNMSSDIIILINWACRHGKTSTLTIQRQTHLLPTFPKTSCALHFWNCLLLLLVLVPVTIMIYPAGRTNKCLENLLLRLLNDLLILPYQKLNRCYEIDRWINQVVWVAQ